MADTPEAIKKSVRTYLFVGGILFLGTIITVLIATVPALDVGHHGFDAMDCVLGLTIATIKACLVAFIFMHLNRSDIVASALPLFLRYTLYLFNHFSVMSSKYKSLLKLLNEFKQPL